jgi:hypothetical protein
MAAEYWRSFLTAPHPYHPASAGGAQPVDHLFGGGGGNLQATTTTPPWTNPSVAGGGVFFDPTSSSFVAGGYRIPNNNNSMGLGGFSSRFSPFLAFNFTKNLKFFVFFSNFFRNPI